MLHEQFSVLDEHFFKEADFGNELLDEKQKRIRFCCLV